MFKILEIRRSSTGFHNTLTLHDSSMARGLLGTHVVSMEKPSCCVSAKSHPLNKIGAFLAVKTINASALDPKTTLFISTLSGLGTNLTLSPYGNTPLASMPDFSPNTSETPVIEISSCCLFVCLDGIRAKAIKKANNNPKPINNSLRFDFLIYCSDELKLRFSAITLSLF